MNPIKSELLELSDEAHGRLAKRIADMADDEYFWEPVPDCWSIRPGEDGKFHGDWGLVFDEVPPVTTIAWRMTHIIDLLSEERCATWIGLTPEEENLFADGPPGSAQASRDLLEKANERWRRYVAATDDDGLFEKCGRVARGFADTTRMQFILHIIDELIHHAAEVGVLRDLYRAERLQDPDVSALLAGKDAQAVDEVRARRPDLVLFAAATARWGAIPRLIELGFGIEGRDGRTPLHHAAADGRIDLIKLLLDRGADVTAQDPIYKATPLVWAEFFNRTEAAELLRSAGA